MIDRMWHSQRGRVRYRWLLRAWTRNSWRWNLRAVLRWLTGAGRWTEGPELSVRTIPHNNGECYCPHGSTTDFRISLWWFGLWFNVSRAPHRQPCTCTKIIWLLFPADHAEDVEAYGLERLQAEFPDVEPL